MTFDDFGHKLRQIKMEYLQTRGVEMKTIEELEVFLDKKLARPKKKGLRSLKGMFDLK